ncbi:DUF4148 domain-containing protein [Paraburkholderia terrae]|uniref:DUF4148 domain-containing protein n=1 Tax=Paraburkholderia TaxID=1822464 RepID=UPI001EE2EA13|nr:DUF4148 domain-containing protein [Paraburkholderia terrae]BEU21157.1 DUF4148 domain-containing protein [Paraburkholderia sp. 22B1P]GJH06943.1 DUF4148 domain-containing protein [Paraburkholderia terrae]
MKQLIAGSMLVMAIVSIAGPTVANAQGTPQTSRALANAELAALERAGYNPAYSEDPNYPYNLQAAERQIAAERATNSQYGSFTGGSSAAGAR